MKTEYVFPSHIVDEAIDAMLKASGSALAFYSMPSSIEIMRTTMQGIMNRALAGTPSQEAEPAGYLFSKSVCRAPDDCEDYEEYVSRASVNPDELAQYQKHGMVIPLYAAQPPAVAVQEQPARVQGVSAGLELAAKFLEKQATDYDEAHGHTESDTGARVYPGDGADYLYTLAEFAEQIRELKPLAQGDPVADDLSALVRRLAHSLKKSNPDSVLPRLAMDCLQRHGLQGSVLREVQEQPAPVPTSERLPTEADADCHGMVWWWNRKDDLWVPLAWDANLNLSFWTHWQRTGLTRPQNPEAGHDQAMHTQST